MSTTCLHAHEARRPDRQVRQRGKRKTQMSRLRGLQMAGGDRELQNFLSQLPTTFKG